MQEPIPNTIFFLFVADVCRLGPSRQSGIRLRTDDASVDVSLGFHPYKDKMRDISGPRANLALSVQSAFGQVQGQKQSCLKPDS